MRDLTEKQKRFITAYSGNATEAARLAGYAGSDQVLGKTGFDLLRNPKIKEQIEKRQEKRVNSLIFNREQRQAFWTDILNDKAQPIQARLKASELLGRSECDFVEKIKMEIEDDVEKLTKEELIEKAKKTLASLEKEK